MLNVIFFCPWKIEKNTKKSCSWLAQTHLFHSPAQATAHSLILIFILMYCDLLTKSWFLDYRMSHKYWANFWSIWVHKRVRVAIPYSFMYSNFRVRIGNPYSFMYSNLWSLVLLLISNLTNELRLHQFLLTKTDEANKSLKTDVNGAH